MTTNTATNTNLKEKLLQKIAEQQVERRTMEEYGESVATLYTLARDHGSGGRCAAQLLLSGYNGNIWQLNVTDLCLLDRENLKAAMTYLECRATLGREPHDLLKDGYDLFVKLQRQWPKLHIDNRWKDQCTNCWGDGEVYVNEHDENDYRTKACEECNGTGLIANVRDF